MHLEPHHTHAQLITLAKSHRHDPIWRKIQAMVLASQGETAGRIANALGASLRSVQDWVVRYNHGGINALKRRSGQGRPPKFPNDLHDALRQRLDAGPTAEDGVCTLRGPDVQRILAREFGVKLSLPSTYELLHRLGYSSLVPRPMHRKTDPEVQERFKRGSGDASARSDGVHPANRSRSGSPTKPAWANMGR